MNGHSFSRVAGHGRGSTQPKVLVGIKRNKIASSYSKDRKHVFVLFCVFGHAECMKKPHKTLSPKELALRAARAATLGLAFAAGCHQSSQAPIQAAEGVDGGFDVATVDTNTPDTNTPDTTTDVLNCHLTDDWLACCEAVAWDPNAGCDAWGPYVPPALGALPSSRPRVG